MVRAPVNGTELFYTTVGQGKPMLAMHGGLGPDHSYFRPWLDALAEFGVEVIYYDHRGGGRSARLSGFEGITHETLVADADGLRAYLGHERMVLLGHSYGGMLAMEYALRHGHRLLGLVLCCTAPAWDYAEEIISNAQARGGPREIEAADRLREGPVPDDETYARLWADMQPLYFKRPEPALISRMHETTRYSASAYNLSEVLLEDFDLCSELSRINVPTLILAGEDDWVTPRSQAERIVGGLPAAELVTFAESGHYPFIEEHELFVQVVSQWVTSLV